MLKDVPKGGTAKLNPEPSGRQTDGGGQELQESQQELQRRRDARDIYVAVWGTDGVGGQGEGDQLWGAL